MNHSQTPQRRRVFGFGSAPVVLCAVIGFLAGMARQSGAQVTYSVDLPVGQVFYVGLLLPGISGSVAPLFEQRFTTPLNRSFFDVGPTLGAPYNLDNTANLTVLGGTHPVVGAGVQSAGNLALRVEALPGPGAAAALTTLALPPILRRNRRRF